jgi:hypothetical protein
MLERQSIPRPHPFQEIMMGFRIGDRVQIVLDRQSNSIMKRG